MELDWLELYNEFRTSTSREALDLTNRRIDFQEVKAFNDYLKAERKKLLETKQSRDRLRKIEKYIW